MRDIACALGAFTIMSYAERGQFAGDKMDDKPRQRRFRPIHLLLLIPYVAMLWVPSYNRIDPMLAGIPFFYWYQMAWILLGVAVLVPVYFYDERHNG
jgi:hypothetical protein